MTNEITGSAPAAAKILTVIDDMDQRRVFESTDEAAAYIQKCQTDFPDFDAYPVAAVGLTDEGDFDSEVYNEDMRIAVSVLSQRANSAMNPTNTSRVHCIVIYPMPKLAAILGADPEGFTNASGLAWLQSAMETELNHVAVRNLRKAADAQEIAEAVEGMPTTIGDYISSGRETSSGILESFNQLWQIIKKGMGAKSKPFALANLSKKELRKAMESSSYAATVYPQLETRVNKKGEPESLFVLASKFGQVLAKENSLDPAIFDRMISLRDEKQIDVADDEAEFDLEAMAASIKKAAATESTEAAPAAAEGETEAEEATA
jgi:hypothetical protein